MIYDFMSADLIYIEFWLIIYQNIKRKKTEIKRSGQWTEPGHNKEFNTFPHDVKSGIRMLKMYNQINSIIYIDNTMC